MSRRGKHKQQVKSGWKMVINTRVSRVWDQSLWPEKGGDFHGVSDKAGVFNHGRSLWVLTPGISGLTRVTRLQSLESPVGTISQTMETQV
jgi:hypothetical protein